MILTHSLATAQYCAAAATILLLLNLVINVFGISNKLFRGKVYLLVKFPEAVYKERFPANRLFLTIPQ